MCVCLCETLGDQRAEQSERWRECVGVQQLCICKSAGMLMMMSRKQQPKSSRRVAEQ